MNQHGGQNPCYSQEEAAKIPVLEKYIQMRDLCRLFGYRYDTKSSRNRARDRVKKEIVRKLVLANGKLDGYDPRRGMTSTANRRCEWRVTMPALRALFPERFDKKDEVIKHLEKRLKEFDKKFDQLFLELEQEKRMSLERDKILRKAIEESRKNRIAS